MKLLPRLLLICLGMAISLPSFGMDISEAWDLALTNDPQYKIAKFSADADQENINIARSKLLPNVSFYAANSRNNQDHKYLNSNYPNSSSNYKSERYVLSVNQPLFNLQKYYGYEQAKSGSAYTAKLAEKEYQEMISRVTGAYLDVLLARNRFENNKTRIHFLESSLDLAKKSFEHGVGTRTDIEDVKANYDSSIADDIELSNAIKVAEQSLSAIVGRHIAAAELLDIFFDAKSTNLSQLSALDEWKKVGSENSPEVLAAKLNLETKQKEVEVRKAGHYPTLDLVASESLSKSDTDYTVGNQYQTQSIGIQVTIPIYAGGGIAASVRQSEIEVEGAKSSVDLAMKKNETEISKQYATLTQGLARIQALEQASLSAETAIDGNQKGLKAGTRNVVDVLNAEQKRYSTQSRLLEARYSTLMGLVNLKKSAGILSDGDIREMAIAPK